MGLEADHTEWDHWWELNRDHWLRLKETVHAVAIQSGSDEFFLGPTRHVLSRDSVEPTDRDRAERVLPALHRALAESPQRDVVSACLCALAKIGRDSPEYPLLPAIAAHLPSADQEIRETAALCLGITRATAALDDLLALVADDARGRALCRRAGVDDRTRAFAIYGLGTLGQGAERAVRERIAAALLPILARPEEHGRDLKVATLHALSLLRPAEPVWDRLAEQMLGALETYHQASLGVGEQYYQAHAATAAARLLCGRGPDALRTRWLALLGADLASAGERRNPALAQTAALALGLIAPPHDGDAAAAAGSPGATSGDLLARTHGEHRDAQTRHFCLVSLAQAGGAGNRAHLLRAFDQGGGKALERPWAALALGVLARRQIDADPTRPADATIGALLADEILTEKNPYALGALAIGLGLCRYQPAMDDLRRLLREHQHQDVLAGHLCIALALLGDRGAVPQLKQVLGASVRRPVLLRQAAAALGVLGDIEAAPSLLELLRDGNANLARTASVAMALGQIGDRRTIDPLCAMLRDDALVAQSRAFAAVALGDTADWRLLPWNEPYARDLNYRAAVESLLDGQFGVLDIL